MKIAALALALMLAVLYDKAKLDDYIVEPMINIEVLTIEPFGYRA